MTKPIELHRGEWWQGLSIMHGTMHVYRVGLQFGPFVHIGYKVPAKSQKWYWSWWTKASFFRQIDYADLKLIR